MNNPQFPTPQNKPKYALVKTAKGIQNLLIDTNQREIIYIRYSVPVIRQSSKKLEYLLIMENKKRKIEKTPILYYVVATNNKNFNNLHLSEIKLLEQIRPEIKKDFQILSFNTPKPQNYKKEKEYIPKIVYQY